MGPTIQKTTIWLNRKPCLKLALTQDGLSEIVVGEGEAQRD